MSNFLMRCVAVVCTLGAALSLSTYGSQQEEETHRYVNCDYGYLVRIPRGLVGTVPQYQNHGFYINLPDGESRIQVSNSYSMSDSKIPKDVFSYELRFVFMRDDYKHFNVTSERTRSVQGLDSMEVTGTYTRNNTSWKSEILLMYRPPKDGLEDVVYQIELSAPAARFKTSLQEFEQTVAGFELTALPRGECSNE
jgi:hypothetical protein